MSVAKNTTRVIGNVAVVFASLIFSILICEGLARAVLDPIDYLDPTIVSDEYLNHRVKENTGGHDAWGFRNFRKPEGADIVSIGDSQTYGVAARAVESWPAVLGAIREQTVYNMGLGAYGPIQYLHLMRTYVIQLKPKIVIVGFSLGTDLWDTYKMARSNRHWEFPETAAGPEPQVPELVIQSPAGRFLRGPREWLRKHSLLYAIATRLPISDLFRRQEATALTPEYRDDRHDVLIHLDHRVRFLDMNDARIKVGMEITKRVLMDMKDEAKKQHFRLIIVLLPTKAQVYGKLLERAGFIDKHLQYAEALRNEIETRKILASFLIANNIDVVDPLPALEAAVEKGDIYPFAESHPNKDGYRIIAETIDQHLRATP